MRTMHTYKIALLVVVAIGILAAATPSSADRVFVRGGTDIRVWVDEAWDVYPSYDDVVISVQAARDCYATVFVVDTDGFVHVVHPFSPYDDAWIFGGETYSYSGYELGLDGLGGRGIAHVFAIGSPYPFDYSPYGESIFVGRFGFRIFGDPFIASREIYLSLLPGSLRLDFVSVSMTRFYIREWVRYPHYLCRGHHSVYVRVGDYCSHCSHVYDGYRVHVADPYPVIHPRVKFKRQASHYAEVKRSTRKFKEQRSTVRSNPRRVSGREATERVKTVRTKVKTNGRVVSRSRVADRREAVAGWTKRSTSSKPRMSKSARPTVPKSTKSTVQSSRKTVRTKSKVTRSTARKGATHKVVSRSSSGNTAPKAKKAQTRSSSTRKSSGVKKVSRGAKQTKRAR
jgi:hypothetical protein